MVPHGKVDALRSGEVVVHCESPIVVEIGSGRGVGSLVVLFTVVGSDAGA